MTRSADHFKEFPPHSKYKHLILQTYFETWGRKMLLRPNAGNSLLYVDACAGRGIDEVGNHGSPIIAAKAAAMAQAQLRDQFHRDVTIHVVAIEKKPSLFKMLAANLQPFGPNARAIRGDFAECLPALQAEFQDTPALFFIDPFGLEPLRGAAVRQALRGPKNEVLVLFHTDAALRHFGAAIAQETKRERELRNHESQTWLLPDVGESIRAELTRQAIASKKSLEVTREKAIEILDAAYEHHDWLAITETTPTHLRAERFLELYVEFLETCGAPYVLPFPVLNVEGDQVYYLVHASKNGVGRRAMKESIEYALKHGPLPTHVADELRAGLDCSVEEVVAAARRKFVGQSVRWAEDPKNKNANCVKFFALEETRMFQHQLLQLRARLGEFREKSGGRSWVFRFPPNDAV